MTCTRDATLEVDDEEGRHTYSGEDYGWIITPEDHIIVWERSTGETTPYPLGRWKGSVTSYPVPRVPVRKEVCEIPELDELAQQHLTGGFTP